MVDIGIIGVNDAIKFIGINNPRRENGNFGAEVCDKCGKYSSAYTFIATWRNPIILCKSCLLDAVDIINKTILNDCIKKGKERHGR